MKKYPWHVVSVQYGSVVYIQEASSCVELLIKQMNVMFVQEDWLYNSDGYGQEDRINPYRVSFCNN